MIDSLDLQIQEKRKEEKKLYKIEVEVYKHLLSKG
jgi:hypothetical protein